MADLPLRYSPSLVEYTSISSVARAFLYMLVKGKVLFRLTRRSKESSRFKLEFPFKFEHLTGRFSSSGKLLAFSCGVYTAPSGLLGCSALICENSRVSREREGMSVCE